MQNTSIIDHPGFDTWINDFRPTDPKFVHEVQKRKEESEARFAALEERAKMIEREMDWQSRVRE